MKSAIIITCAFLSVGAFANNFSQYKGKTYSNERIDQCRIDFDGIVAGLESREGFKVLDGGCAPLTDKVSQIQFSYSHPVVKRIETFSKKAESSETCSAMSRQAQVEFESVDNHYVDSYCHGSYLKVDYIDLTSSILRGLNAPAVFASLNECQAFLSGLESRLAGHGISLLFEKCSEKNTFEGETYYNVRGEVSSRYDISLSFLEGKSVEGACFQDRGDIERSFEENGMKLAHGFCASKSLNGQKREVLAAITFYNGAKIKTFSGVSYATERECSYQLDKAAQGLEELGKPLLYKFCQEGSFERQRPVIYYAHKFSL